MFVVSYFFSANTVTSDTVTSNNNLFRIMSDNFSVIFVRPIVYGKIQHYVIKVVSD